MSSTPPSSVGSSPVVSRDRSSGRKKRSFLKKLTNNSDQSDISYSPPSNRRKSNQERDSSSSSSRSASLRHTRKKRSATSTTPVKISSEKQQQTQGSTAPDAASSAVASTLDIENVSSTTANIASNVTSDLPSDESKTKTKKSNTIKRQQPSDTTDQPITNDIKNNNSNSNSNETSDNDDESSVTSELSLNSTRDDEQRGATTQADVDADTSCSSSGPPPPPPDDDESLPLSAARTSSRSGGADESVSSKGEKARPRDQLLASYDSDSSVQRSRSSSRRHQGSKPSAPAPQPQLLRRASTIGAEPFAGIAASRSRFLTAVERANCGMPLEVMLLVLARLRPRQLAPLAAVCHTWRKVCRDDCVWQRVWPRDNTPRVPSGLHEAYVHWNKVQTSRRAKPTVWADAVELFNRGEHHPAIGTLVQHGALANSPQDLVHLLMTPGVSKLSIGAFLGSREMIEIFDEFLLRLDFGGKRLTEAFAALVQHVILPADTAKIDHISRVFARKYYTQNANAEFQSADAVYYVVLLIIMLNTSINQTVDSNDATATHMSSSQFIELAAGLNDGQNFSKDFLEQLYDDVVSDSYAATRRGSDPTNRKDTLTSSASSVLPMPTSPVPHTVNAETAAASLAAARAADGVDTPASPVLAPFRQRSTKRNTVSFVADVLKQGWLQKQTSGLVKRWDARWFVLKSNNCLYYYKSPDAERVLGVLPLTGVKITVDLAHKRYVIKIEKATPGNSAAATTTHGGSGAASSPSATAVDSAANSSGDTSATSPSTPNSGVQAAKLNAKGVAVHAGKESYHLAGKTKDECHEWARQLQTCCERVVSVDSLAELMAGEREAKARRRERKQKQLDAARARKASSPNKAFGRRRPTNDSSVVGTNSASVASTMPGRASGEQRGKLAVFRMPLDTLAERDGCMVPVFVRKAVDYLMANGLEEVGLLRLSGNQSEMNRMRVGFDNGGPIDFTGVDVNTVAGLLKAFFRELPEPLLSPALNRRAANIVGKGMPEIPTALELRDVIVDMPGPQYETLKILVQFLCAVADKADKNKMHKDNLLTVMIPTMQIVPQVFTHAMDCFELFFDSEANGRDDTPQGRLQQQQQQEQQRRQQRRSLSLDEGTSPLRTLSTSASSLPKPSIGDSADTTPLASLSSSANVPLSRNRPGPATTMASSSSSSALLSPAAVNKSPARSTSPRAATLPASTRAALLAPKPKTKAPAPPLPKDSNRVRDDDDEDDGNNNNNNGDNDADNINNNDTTKNDTAVTDDDQNDSAAAANNNNNNNSRRGRRSRKNTTDLESNGSAAGAADSSSSPSNTPSTTGRNSPRLAADGTASPRTSTSSTPKSPRSPRTVKSPRGTRSPSRHKSPSGRSRSSRAKSPSRTKSPRKAKSPSRRRDKIASAAATAAAAREAAATTPEPSSSSKSLDTPAQSKPNNDKPDQPVSAATTSKPSRDSWSIV